MQTISMERNVSPKSLVIAAFTALYIIWGSTYLGILIAMKSITPFFLLGSRFTIAGILLMSYCLLKRERIPDAVSVGKLSICGILMLFMGTGTVIWVEQYLPSGIAAIVVATLPLWFVLIDRRNWKQNFSDFRIIAGLLVGFAGVLLLFSGNGAAMFSGHPMQLISFFLLIIGTICWATGSLYAKYESMNGTTAMKVAIQMLAAGLLALIVGFVTGEQHHFSISQVTGKSLAALAYLVCFGSLVGYMAYVWLLSVRPPSLVGTYAYVNPVVAVFLGWLIASEKVSIQQVYALGIILAGVILVNLSKNH